MMLDGLDPESVFRGPGSREERFSPRAPDDGLEPPQYSDDSVAMAFTDRHADKLRFVAEWGHWLCWDGARWAQDKTLIVFDLVRLMCRKIAAQARAESNRAEPWSIARLASKQKVAAVESLARADRRHARTADAFDADPWALNTPSGVIDLKTGTLRERVENEPHTKVTAVAPGGECPMWRAFLLEIFQGDAEAVAYMQRWAGYMLTGSTREHAFLFLYGPGGNGKSLLMSTISAMLGSYATSADMELFTMQHGTQHPTGIADLFGARLVVAQETEANRALAEAKLKTLTGGDLVKARFMGRDFFHFAPVLKLVMAGNHRPVIRNPDEAMRRRLHLLPMTWRPETPDPKLADRLQKELPGILRWAIEGCLAWQTEGLGRPRVVVEATAEYFAEQDLMAQWLAERCLQVRGGEAPSSALYRDWQFWAKERGEDAGTGKAFSAAMERHHAKRRTNSGVQFLGLKLRPSDTGIV